MGGGTYGLELRTSGLEELVVDLLGEEDVSTIAALDHLEELYGMEGGSRGILSRGMASLALSQWTISTLALVSMSMASWGILRVTRI